MQKKRKKLKKKRENRLKKINCARSGAIFLVTRISGNKSILYIYWSFPIVRYFKWNPKCFTNNLTIILDYPLRNRRYVSFTIKRSWLRVSEVLERYIILVPFYLFLPSIAPHLSIKGISACWVVKSVQ